MQIFTKLQPILTPSKPVALTIGTFDGLHLGHQTVINRLLDRAKSEKKQTALITFSNHPLTILNPTQSPPLICTTAHRVMLLEKAGIDTLILLPFTKELSKQSAQTFLNHIKDVIPFDILILGNDAHIGKNREGNKEIIRSLAGIMGFTVEYCPDLIENGQRISSTQIRIAIQQGCFDHAEKLLARPYSIYGAISKINNDIYTLPTENLCLPPKGFYPVTLETAVQGEKVMQDLSHSTVVSRINLISPKKTIPATAHINDRIEIQLKIPSIDINGSYAEIQWTSGRERNGQASMDEQNGYVSK